MAGKSGPVPIADASRQIETPKGRIRPELEAAIRLIVENGYTHQEAADFIGYKRETISKALHKPHVRHFAAGVKRAWMESQTALAWQTVAKLAIGANSEQVRLAAAKTFLEAQGELGNAPEAEQRAQTLIQIVAQAGATIALPNDRGVIERPPLDVEYQLIEGPADSDDELDD